MIIKPLPASKGLASNTALSDFCFQEWPEMLMHALRSLGVVRRQGALQRIIQGLLAQAPGEEPRLVRPISTHHNCSLSMLLHIFMAHFKLAERIQGIWKDLHLQLLVLIWISEALHG